MAEQVDVCIVGSGFGGSIAAWRLAELYRAADTEPSVVVLERGLRMGHKDFRQSMDVDHLSNVYGLIQGEGAQIVIANLVGGGSNLYLAASLRAPHETFERHDARPDDGPRRRMWPKAISRKTLNPYYARVERGLRVAPTPWNRVSKSGGIWAAMLREAGYTCDRVPTAISPERCVNAKWCYTGCIFGAKNSLITNYLASAERQGVEVRPLVQVNSIAPSGSAPYRWVGRRDGHGADPDADPPERGSAADLIPPRQAPRRQRRSRGGDRDQSREGPGGARTAALRPVLQGSPDHRDELRLLGRQARLTARRHPLHPPGDPALSAHQLPVRRRAKARRRALVVGEAEEALDLHLVRPHRDPGDGRGHERRRLLRRAARGWRTRPTQRRAGRDRHVQLRAFRAVRPGEGGGRQGDEADRGAPRRGQVPEALRDAGRLRLAPPGGLPDGRWPGPRGGRRSLRGLQLRGPLLHGLLGDPHQPRGQSIAHDLGGLRACGGQARAARRRLRASEAAERFSVQDARRARGPTNPSVMALRSLARWALSALVTFGRPQWTTTTLLE